MLNENEVKYYNQNGYLILRDKLDKDTLSDLKNSTAQLIEEFKKNQSIFIKDKKRNISKHGKMFLSNRCEDFPLMEKFTKGSFVKSICKSILGEKVYLFNEQVVNKEPQTESKFAWHQNTGNVGHDHKSELASWLALGDTNEKKGALKILPTNLEREAKIEEHIWSEQSSDLSMKVEEEKSISCTIEEGGLVLFSSRTPHASFPNKSNKNRPAYLCQYSSEPILPPPGSNKKFRAELI